MLTRFFVFAALICFAIVSQPQASHALTCSSWKEAEKSIRWWWEKAYPKEKILTIEQNGPPQTYSKVKSTNQKKIDEYGNEWEYFQKNPYCSVPAKLKVQQPSGPRIFNVSAVFKVSGKKFTFDDVATGGSEAVLEAGQAPAPPNDEIVKLVTEKLNSRIPPALRSKIVIDKLELPSKPSLSRFGEGQSVWSIEKMNLYMTVDGEKQKNCEIMMINVSKGDEKSMRLDAGGPWIVMFALKDTPSYCVPQKYVSKVNNFINNIPEKEEPPVDISWFKDAAGVYKGNIRVGQNYEATTTFTQGADGSLSGTFSYMMGSKQVSGTINNCNVFNTRAVQCDWQNQSDKGTADFWFKQAMNAFSGSWKSARNEDGRWEGKRISGAVTAAGGSAAKPTEAAAPPALKNMMKGLGF